jgi:hypothetical protein
MSVFLRWGIFGILSVAGLVYAYNASKSLAEKRATRNTADAAIQVQPDETPDAEGPGRTTVTTVTTVPQCEEELAVAERALAARAESVPLDRLLRIQEIAFQEPPRRSRLEKVATLWFGFDGAEPSAEALRAAVIADCEKARNP